MCVCVRCEVGASTCDCKHPLEHPARTRAPSSLLCREEAAASSILSTRTSLPLTHKEVNATHVHACRHAHAHAQLLWVHRRERFPRHSPETKATFSFRMGRTSEAFKPSFRKEPVGQQDRRNQGERRQVAESLGPTLSLPNTPWARKSCLIQALQPGPMEQERVHF